MTSDLSPERKYNPLSPSQVFHESIGLSTKVEIGGSSASYAPYYGQCISSKPLQMLSYAGLADVQV